MRFDAFLRYAVAKCAQQQKNELYRVYVTDTLKNIAENTANVSAANGVSGKYSTKRYYDVLHPAPEDNRSAEEIITSIKDKLNGLE